MVMWISTVAERLSAKVVEYITRQILSVGDRGTVTLYVQHGRVEGADAMTKSKYEPEAAA